MSNEREFPLWLQRVIVAVLIAGANIVGFFMHLAEPQPKEPPHAD